MLRLLRVMFPPMLLGVSRGVFMGMLNARGHFFIPAMGATMLNVVMIASTLWLEAGVGQNAGRKKIFALAIGVLGAGAGAGGVSTAEPATEGFHYRWVRPWGDPTVRHIVKQMIPGTIGVASYQIIRPARKGLALLPRHGIVIQFQYAVRLMELPQGVFGISLATFLCRR